MPAPKKSMRPKKRPESSAPSASKRPPSPKMIGVRGNPGLGEDAYMGEEIGVRGNPGIGRDAYSPEDFERLMDSQDARMPQKFRDGGSVRGCKSSQMSGKGFSGSY